ncbi:hypothetical protein ACGFNU_49880 [Spirillospora sp. NPDC048911]|uniref:hypothetical protein n=1 Tax=Spirillospora sp. NPDC048911 TaxID=3364527 RepID=UPI003719BAED
METTFSGAVDFNEMDVGPVTVELDGARVADAGDSHALPSGWRIEPDGDGGGNIVAEAGSPA